MYLFARAFYPFGYFMIVSVFSPSAAGVFSLSGGSLHSTHEHKSARIRPSRTRAPNAAGSLAVEAPPYRPERQSFRDFYFGFFAKPKNATFFFFFLRFVHTLVGNTLVRNANVSKPKTIREHFTPAPSNAVF